MMLVFLASLYCSITEERIWPFAPYDMYSTTGTAYCSQYYLEAESLSGRRFSLSGGTYLHPFGNRELVFKIFPPLLDDPARLDERLRLLARHYTDRMRQKKHSGPSLAAVRLYRLTWRPMSRAQNLRSPDKMTLLREIRW